MKLISKYLLSFTKKLIYRDITSNILQLLKEKSRTNLKFSHLCFWNLITCKYIYKKMIELPCIKNLMFELMNEWEGINSEDNNNNIYISLFNNYPSFNDFCQHNLIQFNDISNFISNNEINIEKLEKQIKELRNISTFSDNNNTKWKSYISFLSFVDDIIILSELLKKINTEKRNEILKEVVLLMNKEEFPLMMYLPFEEDFDIKYLKRINSDFSFCLSTKSHVPYHLLLELVNLEEMKDVQKDSNKEERNIITNNFNNNTFEENEKNFQQHIFASRNSYLQGKSNLQHNENNNIKSFNLKDPSQKGNDNSKNNNSNNTNGISKYFSLSYYFSGMLSLFSCGNHPTENDNSNLFSREQNLDTYSSTKNEYTIQNNFKKDNTFSNNNPSNFQTTNFHTVSPDSIGIFGSLKFSEISQTLSETSPFKSLHLLPIIIKGGEDLRQDLFVSQVINVFLSIFKREQINIFLQPLKVLPTGTGGIMQTIIDTTNLTKINKIDFTQIEGYSHNTLYIEPEIDPQNLRHSPLSNYFTFKYGNETQDEIKAIHNFVSSLAGYSLLCYFLEIKDRNNGNILLNEKGQLIHIDFGFLLSCSPGNVNFEQAPFKLTYDFIELMRGSDSEYFKEYKTLLFNGFKALRKYYWAIVAFVQMFMVSNWDLPCFYHKEKIIYNLEQKFCLEIQEEEKLKEYVEGLITTSLNNWRTKMYDGFQKMCVGIN